MQAYKYFFALKNGYLTFIYQVLLFKAPIALASHNIKPGSTVTSHPSVKGKMEEGTHFTFYGIIRICGGSMLVVFLGRPHTRIYILNEN